MSTAILRTHQGKVSLARGSLAKSPPTMDELKGDDASDVSTSPHVNTLRSSKPEASIKSIANPGEEIVMRTASSTCATNSEQGVMNHQHEPCGDDDKYASSSDVQLSPCVPLESNTTNRDETATPDVADPTETDAPNPNGQNDYPPMPPTECLPNTPILHTIPSSSIPHLLSASSSFSSGKVIHHQLSFVGLEAALPATTTCERSESFSFSVDGEDGEFKYNSPSRHRAAPPYNQGLLNYTPPAMLQAIQPLPQSHNILHMTQEAQLSDGGAQFNSSDTGAPNTSSSQNAQSSMTPPHVLGVTTISPPLKVSMMNTQNSRRNLGQPAQNQLVPPKVNSPGSSSSLEQQTNTGNNANNSYATTGTGNNIMHATTSAADNELCQTVLTAVPLQRQQLQPPYQNNYRYQKKPSVVRPVLYSAFNSLERYNAGSFDNKVIMAKAYGRLGRQKAFPGVPNKNGEDVSGGTSLDSDLASSMSSRMSTDLVRRKGSLGSMGDGSESHSTMSDTRELNGLSIMPSESSDGGQQVGQNSKGEKLVPIVQNQSGRKIIKAKSSGNLDQSDEKTPESLAELKTRRKSSKNRGVTIDDKYTSKKGKPREKKVGVFRPSCDAYTPRMGNRAIKYKTAEERPSVEKMSSTMGTIQRPNFRDALRRVAIILHQHIVKIERRFVTGIRGIDDTGLFKSSMREYFSEDNFATPRYKCSMVRVPMARPGVVYSMRKIRVSYNTPTTDEIYEFAHQLFKKVQLSSECSIVCLIYVEKLMEVAKVPLVASTWRPIFMCGLLLASKVWQDLSSWNIEFASVYPQFSLDAINRLEVQFLKFIKWDLYISSSLYAKYYFALRSLLEKSGFRDRYNQMVGGFGGIAASEAIKVSKRSEAVKEEALLQLSRSM